jgi:hypothetical protein
MTVDCRWVEENLENLFCDRLSDEESKRIRAHIENCETCKKESEALRAIDPVVKQYFQRELRVARRPRLVHKGRLIGVGAAGLATVFALLLLFRTPQVAPILTPVPVADNAPATSPTPSSPAIKSPEPEQGTEVGRAKPTANESAPVDRRLEVAPKVTSNSPDFLITDPAGYMHRLDEYRGHVVVIGVWSPEQRAAILNLERVYKASSTNPKIRVLGVSIKSERKPTNTTFPMFHNEGSKLLGAQSGEYVMLDESGAIVLRGSLVKDSETLIKNLQKR